MYITVYSRMYASTFMHCMHARVSTTQHTEGKKKVEGISQAHSGMHACNKSLACRSSTLIYWGLHELQNCLGTLPGEVVDPIFNADASRKA